MATYVLTNEETVLPWGEFAVDVKAAWGDEWEPVDSPMGAVAGTIDPIEIKQVLAPGVSTATFVYHYGRLAHIRDPFIPGQFADIERIDLTNWYIRVQAARTPDSGWRTLFVGIIVDDGDEVDAAPERPQGDQILRAYGLEHILDRQAITCAYAYCPATSSVEAVDTIPTFNRRRRWGVGLVGNRSGTDGDQSYFDDAAGYTWRASDIAAYHLARFAPDGMTFALSGQTTILDNMKTVETIHRGSVWQALTHIIRRQRGCTLWIPPVDSGTINVEVRSTLGAPITVGTVTIPANTEIVQLDFYDAHSASPTRITRSTRSRYDKLIVRGAPIGVLASWAHADATLEEGWTAGEETAYEAGSGETGATADEHDAERKTDKFIRVFQHHRVPHAWNGECGDGEGGTKRNALLSCDADGAVSSSPASTWYPGGKGFQRNIPLLITAGATNATPEYRKAFAVAKCSRDARWYQLDAIPPKIDDLSSSRFRVLPDELAVLLEPEINHLLADNHFSGAEPSNTEPAFDYDTLILTAFLRLDERFSIETEIAEGEQSGTGQTLVIDVPTAEYWYALQGAVTHIEDGALVKQGATGNVLRNDLCILEGIGALAKAWYGEPRAQLSLCFRQLVDFLITNINSVPYTLLPGTYLQAIVAEAQTFDPVNAIVSSVVYDIREGITTIETDWGELDASAFVEFPGLSEPRGVAQAILRHEDDLAEIRAVLATPDHRPGHIARQIRFAAKIVNTPPSGFGSVPTDKPVYAVKRVEPNNTDALNYPVTWSEVTGALALHSFATNVAEPPTTHDLPDDEDLIVECWLDYDGSTPPLRRLCFRRPILTAPAFTDTIFVTRLTTGSPGSANVAYRLRRDDTCKGEAREYFAFEMNGDNPVIWTDKPTTGELVYFMIRTGALCDHMCTAYDGPLDASSQLLIEWVTSDFSLDSEDPDYLEWGNQPTCSALATVSTILLDTADAALGEDREPVFLVSCGVGDIPATIYGLRLRIVVDGEDAGVGPVPPAEQIAGEYTYTEFNVPAWINLDDPST